MTYSLLPVIIIFSLKNVIWPINLDEVLCPCSRSYSNQIIDKFKEVYNHFPEVPKVFEKLKNMSIEIAVINNSNNTREANELIRCFNWDEIISFKEIYWGNITDHFRNIQRKSEVPFHKMMYLTVNSSTIEPVSKLGVFSIHINCDGITMKILEVALEQYESMRKKKRNFRTKRNS